VSDHTITSSECQRRCREAERAALERAAQWHDGEAQRIIKIVPDGMVLTEIMIRHCVQTHEASAAAIRALIGVPHTGEGD